MATEDALNKAAEARNLCQNLIKRLHGNSDVVSSGISQNVGSLRQLEVKKICISIEVNYHGLAEIVPLVRGSVLILGAIWNVVNSVL